MRVQRPEYPAFDDTRLERYPGDYRTGERSVRVRRLPYGAEINGSDRA